MRRTCERPGCGEPASVAFAMVPEDLLVWLEACDPATLGDDRPGLLCRRHADGMSVPVGWTLDDRREAVPRLFRVRTAPVPPRPSGDHTGRTRRPKLHQESLLDLDPAAVAELPEPIPTVTTAEEPPAVTATPATPAPVTAAAAVEAAAVGAAAVADASDAPQPLPPATEPAGVPPAAVAAATAWAPRFDRSDDLDGLLAPRGRLLRRAFGAEPTA